MMDLFQFTGQLFTFSFEIDQYFYHSSSENNFTFSCEYSAPIGNVNFIFPDEPCAALSDLNFSTGFSSTIDELVINEIWQATSGSSLFIDFSVFRDLKQSIISTGSELLFNLSPQALLSSNAYVGQSSQIDLTTSTHQDFSFLFYSGQTLSGNLGTETTLDLSFISGSYFDVYGVKIEPNYSLSFGGNQFSINQKCITLQSGVYGDYGINVASNIPNSLFYNNLPLRIAFKRTRPSSWYDDIIGNAQLYFCIFPNRNFQEVQYYSGPWDYQLIMPLPQALYIEFRYSLTSPMRLRWYDSSNTPKTFNFSVISNFTLNEVSGLDECVIEIKTASDKTSIIVYSASGEVRQSLVTTQLTNIWNNPRTTNNSLFVIHYHNYQNNRPEILCDVSLEIPSLSSSLSFILGDIVCYSGSVLDFSLSQEKRLNVDFLNGSNVSLELTTVPAFNFSVIFPSGCSADIGISTYSRLSFDFSSGQSQTTVLSTSPSQQISLNFISGSAAQTTMTAFPGISSLSFFSDHTVSFDFSVFPNPGMIFTGWFSGQTVELDGLSTTYNIPLGFYQGQYSEVNLSTEYALSFLNHTGSNLGITLFTALAPSFTLLFNTDHNLSLQFSTSVIIPIRQYVGQEMFFDISVPISYGLQLTSSIGIYSELNLQTSIALELGRLFTGTSLLVSTLEFEPHWFFIQGSTMNAELSTSDIFELDFVNGVSIDSALSVKPGEKIDFTFYSGHTFHSFVNAVYHVNFYVTFEQSISTQVDMDSTTYFDLNSDKCCRK